MVIPYISFKGRCAEALDLYSRVFGAEAEMLQRYDDYVPTGLDPVPQGIAHWVLHAEMTLCGSRVWFADEPGVGEPTGALKLVVRLSTAAEAGAVFDGLAEGGEVVLPPTDTFYSAFHAGVRDRFGVTWNVVADEPPAGGPVGG